jgi:hypothetical protein
MSPDSSFFAQPADSAKPYAGASVSDASSSLVSADAKSASRSIPTLSYAELDAHIADLGRLSEKAMADGDPHGSHLFAMEMYRAIKSRCLAPRRSCTPRPTGAWMRASITSIGRGGWTRNG